MDRDNEPMCVCNGAGPYDGSGGQKPMQKRQEGMMEKGYEQPDSC